MDESGKGSKEKIWKTNALVAFSLHNPHFIFVACVLIFIFGTLALLSLPKDLLPASNSPAIQILSFYPGMPVEHVEKNLTARFERYTGQAIGVDHQDSRSLLGVSVVRNFFNQQSDLNGATSQTTSMAMSVLSRLPPGTQPPLILPFDPMASAPLGLVAVSGNYEERDLYDKARYEVRNAVQSVPGALAPTVMGGSERQVVIYLKPEKLRRYNLSPLEVIEKVGRLNTFIPTGNVKIGKTDYQITSNGIIDDIEKMNLLPLRSENGTTILLKDVGSAEDSTKVQTNIVSIDGKRQVYVPVYRQPGSNSFQVVEDVKASIANLSSRQPGFHLSLISDQTKYIRNAITSITEEGFIGGALAIFLVFLLLGDTRSTLGILLSLPLSALFAFVGLKLAGQTINAMTLGGLAISIGIVVDNSIVVLENINKHLEEGATPQEAAMRGASEMAQPVFAASIATLLVLFPVILLSGIAKTLFQALAITKVVALVGSYLISMTVMPLFAVKFLRSKQKKSLPHASVAIDRPWILQAIARSFFARLEATYLRYLRLALGHKRYVITACTGLLVVSLFLIPFLGTELFPRSDAGSFILQLRQTSGSRIEETEKLGVAVEKKLREWISPGDLSVIIRNAGVSYGFAAAFTPNSGPQDVFFVVELTDTRKQTSQEIAKTLREKIPKEFPGVEIGIELGGLMSSALNNGLRAPINIQIDGPDYRESHRIATALAGQMKRLPGATDVRVQQKLDAPQIVLKVDRLKASQLGLNTEEVIKNVVSAVSGSSTFYPSIWVDKRTGIDYMLGVQFREDSVSSLKALGDIPITGRFQESAIPLNGIAELGESAGPTEIHHVNLNNVIDIFMDAQDRDIGGLSNDVQNVIDHFTLPASYRVSIQGEISEMKSSLKSMGAGLVLAALLVYLIFVIQFRSFSIPAIILTTVPLGFAGVVLSLFFTHTYFSIQAGIGSILMVGIAVSNGVLLLEFFTSYETRGSTLEDAILLGAKARLRPILMTSLASILALMPMAFGMGRASEANVPLGRAVVGGQLISTFLTLFLIPVLYAFISRRETVRTAEILPMKREAA
ncbi:MAG: efflux RND transporter permease subunit [Cryobacterium sp.]|nr:efflux RND transporter permease subunit [Oligoflexia bacterium]